MGKRYANLCIAKSRVGVVSPRKCDGEPRVGAESMTENHSESRANPAFLLEYRLIIYKEG